MASAVGAVASIHRVARIDSTEILMLSAQIPTLSYDALLGSRSELPELIEISSCFLCHSSLLTNTSNT
eukprot:22396-Amphidinium_carterae.1